jgi:hypothetical protein
MKYTPEEREGKWFAVDREVGVELACWFESYTTCEEVGRRTELDDISGQYMNNIPVVPVDTPVPRPKNVKPIHPITIRTADSSSPAPRRHRLNPSR